MKRGISIIFSSDFYITYPIGEVEETFWKYIDDITVKLKVYFPWSISSIPSSSFGIKYYLHRSRAIYIKLRKSVSKVERVTSEKLRDFHRFYLFTSHKFFTTNHWSFTLCYWSTCLRCILNAYSKYVICYKCIIIFFCLCSGTRTKPSSPLITS